MKPRGGIKDSIFFLLLFYVGHLVALNPLLDPLLCGQPTCETPKKFNYQVGSKYTYKYTVDVSTLFRGTSANRSTLFTESQVHLTFLAPCQGLLQISDVSLLSERPLYDREEDLDITGTPLPRAEEFARALEQKSLRFSFQDGAISELCPDSDDPVWVLNFKRGVLSAFHNTMVRFDVDSSDVESDVNGECGTTYQLEGSESTSLVIHKEKDIATCRNRFKYRALIQTDPYNFGSNYQTVPIVKSRHRCQFSIDRKLYSNIECEEVHTFQPFSRAENGSQSITRQRITLIAENNLNATLPGEPLTKRVSLMFDHNATPKPTSGELKASRDLIKALCRLHTDDVQIGYPDAFTKLVHVGRRLSYTALSQIYNRAGSLCSTGRKHMSDILPYLGSNAAVAVMVENMDKVLPDVAQEWMVSIAFIPSPDKETLNTFLRLVNHSDHQVMLTMSALAHSYCKHESSCQTSEPIQMIMNVLNERLLGCTQDTLTQDERDKILIGLKAVGNLGIATSELAQSLKECVLSDSVDMEVKTSAVTAHRRLPCLDGRDFFLDIYRNNSLDTEVRISSYLQVMRCPNYHVIQLIRQQLELEEINQVGSFVWSHLQNQLSSAMPAKVVTQTLLTDKVLSEKFNKDRRKFSRSYESSIFFDEYNAGGNMESHIIFSPQSYLPRSLMANLTLDLFGESVNVVEVEARGEGFEIFLEKIFGPGGPISGSVVGNKMDKVLRVIRGADPEDDIVSQVNELPNVIGNNFREPKFSVGYKIFGNEISYKSIRGHKQFFEMLQKMNPANRIKQLLSGQEFEFDKASMFLEGEYTVPTGVGLPVTLNVIGTSAVHLNMAGNVRNLELLAMDVEGKFKPSVAVDITGEMGVDAFYASTGVKVKASLYTSTAVEGQIKVEGPKKATVSFNLPKEKGEIITAKSKLIVMKGDEEEEQIGLTEQRVEAHFCSWQSLDNSLGLKLCVDAAFPNATRYSPDNTTLLTILEKPAGNLSDISPSLLFSGPILLAMVVHKADPTAERYVLQYRWDQEGNTTAISLVFDTPGSAQNRELSARILLDNQSKNLTLLLRGNENKFEAHGKYKYTPTEKYLDFSLDINGKQHMVAQVGLRTRAIKHGHQYFPKLYLAINSERIAELWGNVKVQEKKDVSLCEVNLNFKTKKLTLKVEGFITEGQATWSMNMIVNYEFAGGTPQRFMVDIRVGNSSSKNLSQYNGALKMESTAYSYLNFVSSAMFQRSQGHADCKLVVNTRPDLKDDKYEFTAHFGFSVQKTIKQTVLNTFLAFTKPISNIDLKFSLAFTSQHEKSNTYITLRYATDKEVTASLALSMANTELLKFDGKLNVTLPGFVPMIFSLKLLENPKREYDIQMEGVWFSGHNFTAAGMYSDKSEGVLKSYYIKLFVISPSFEGVTLQGRFVSDEHQFKFEVSAEQLNDKYGFALKHAMYAPGEMEAHAEVRYKSSLYSLTTIVNMMKQKQIIMELHLDTHRDIHIALSGVNQATSKEAGVEIKWDANRDPGQRFAARVRFHRPQNLNYSADVAVSYPGRNVLGSVLFAIKGTTFNSGLHLEWSPADVIDVSANAVYSNVNVTDFRISCQLLTPFKGWAKSAISGKFLAEGNRVETDGTAWWQGDQMVSVKVYWDYNLPDSDETTELSPTDLALDDEKVQLSHIIRSYFPNFWCAFNASLDTTVPDMKPVRAAFTHNQKDNTLETMLLWKGKPEVPLLLKSFWSLEETINSTLVKGNVTLQSPYKGYQRGLLTASLHYTTDLNVDGLAELILDRKEYFGTIKGHVTSLRDNMLIVNLTTPLPQFSGVTGRLGYMEADHHLVCMWTMPNSALGIEIRLDYESMKNFDLLFHVATPLQFFNRLLLLGNRKTNMIDARIGFNQLLLGTFGSWRYDRLLDFDYRYTVFTPLEGFEETGIVAKVVVKNGFDIDLRTRVADVKVGLSLIWAPKTSGLRKVLLKMPSDSEEMDDEPENPMRWQGALLLDTYLYKSITGDLELDEIGSTVVVEGNLLLPKGNVYLYDEFYFSDVFNIKNDLQLVTPYSVCLEITSIANWYFMPMDEMLSDFEVHIKSVNATNKGGMRIKFKTIDPEAEEGIEGLPITYFGDLHLHTPWEALRLLQMSTVVEKSETNINANLTIISNDTSFWTDAKVTLEEGYQKANLHMKISSPLYNTPEIIIEGKRDLAQSGDAVEVSLRIPELGLKYRFDGFRDFEGYRRLNARGHIETPWEYLQQLEVKIFFLSAENNTSIDTYVLYNTEKEFKMNGRKLGSVLELNAATPFNGLQKLIFEGNIEDMTEENYNVIGSLNIDDTVYATKVQINGLTKRTDIKVLLEPQKEGVRTISGSLSHFLNEADKATEFMMDIRVGEHVPLRTHIKILPGLEFKKLYIDIDCKHPELYWLTWNVNIQHGDDDRWTIDAIGKLPMPGFSEISFGTNYWNGNYSKKITGYVKSEAVSGQLRSEYAWLRAENMAVLLSLDYKRANEDARHGHAELFFKHPGRNLKYLSTGLDIEIDRLYRFGTNATLSLPSVQDIAINLNLKLPHPGDVHSLTAKARHTQSYSYVAHTLQYSSLVGQAVAATSGEASLNKSETVGNIKFEWGVQPNVLTVTNVFLFKKPNNSHIDMQYTLHTPHFKEDTLVAKIKGECFEDVWGASGQLYYPRSNQLAAANVSYKNLDNINGTLQAKTPFVRLPTAAVEIGIQSNLGHFFRYIKAEWPNNTAVLKSDYTDIYTYTSEGRTRDLKGSLLVEIPLATKHVADVTYKYQDAYPKSSGECLVNYNDNKLLDGRYICISESRGGSDKDDVTVTAQNSYFPLGIHYIHEVDYHDETYTTDRQWADVFRLDNRTAFSVSGQLNVKHFETGKEIKIKVLQDNNTVDVDTDYHFLDHKFTHRSKLQLAPTIWLSYDLLLINKTSELQDEGDFELEIAYPRKNLTLTGHIRQDALSHESHMRLDWDRSFAPKTIGAGLDWWRASRKPDQQVATLRLTHPTFVKDVTFNGTYIRHGMKSLMTQLDVEYSNISDNHLHLKASAQDLSHPGKTFYQVDVIATHPKTRLDLDARSYISISGGEYIARGDAGYKRSFLSQQKGSILGRINANLKEIDFQKRLQHEESYLRGKLYNDDPSFTRVNGSVAKTDVLNYTGDFFIDLDEKLLLFAVNMTPDASHFFRAHGFIPDSRNAELNVWRSYDGLTVTDISYYLRLNHSRLVTSRLKWRPTLRREVMTRIEEVYLGVLKNVDDTVDYWKEYIRSEVKETIADVYEDSKTHIQTFLDDLNDLKSLENDFIELRNHLNESYHRNDFYMKDTIEKVVLLMDELALKGQIESLPAILGEIWQALGESGEAIRRSVLWIIETIKSSYRQAVEVFHQLLHGDASERLSTLLEEWVAKYDRLVKELQMTVVKHIDQLFNSFLETVAESWNNLLRTIEPTYIQIVHYAEDLAWNASHEILDFLYERQEEMKESPFFAQVANLTSDLEKIHKNLLERDIFTNIQDYSNRLYTLIKERYITKIPFGKEIQQVVAEIIEGFQELEKLPSINFFVKKRDEALKNIQWFWRSLELGPKIKMAATLIHRRLIDVSSNALQVENKYREAKTKFVFEPEQGLVLLEQKLPMSWHAFNETPRFEEIPEYRVFATIQRQLASSNKTFWTFYYEYKPYTEMHNWLPPFKGQAIIAGSQHVLTFDGRFLSFRGKCDYLLARDFVGSNFSLVMLRQPTTKSDEYLLGIVNNDLLLTIDIFNDMVHLPRGAPSQLPTQLGHLFVYKENGVVTVEERDGFILQCNTLFQVCTLSLSGWYYGKTAGILGTMDHEYATDLLTSGGLIANSVDVFAHSWALDGGNCTDSVNLAATPTNPDEELVKDCHMLFQAKISGFSTCFGRVNPAPFYNMCISNRREMCSAAAAYVQTCMTQYTLLSLPDICVYCKLPDGKLLPEGKSIKLVSNDVPKSADIVLIVEAKACNKDMQSQRNMDLFLTILGKELDEAGLKDNRYAMVVFGGDGVYNKPRSLETEQGVFANRQTLLRSLHRLQMGNGSEDIFEAIAFSSELDYRPGVSKLFIVIPCSSCDPSNMTTEYSVLRQVLLESNVRLHIIMNSDFGFEKQRLAKIFYGMDSEHAFTKKDFPEVKGDADLRRQTKLPKSIMGYCAPLALETNGTVFTAKWLVGDKKNPVKKFATVFAKRVAYSAPPVRCQNCECSSRETGAGYMDCQACHYASPIYVDLGPMDYVEADDAFSEGDNYEDTVEADKTSDESVEGSADR